MFPVQATLFSSARVCNKELQALIGGEDEDIGIEILSPFDDLPLQLILTPKSHVYWILGIPLDEACTTVSLLLPWGQGIFSYERH